MAASRVRGLFDNFTVTQGASISPLAIAFLVGYNGFMIVHGIAPKSDPYRKCTIGLPFSE